MCENRGCLISSDGEIHLEPRVFSVLQVLVRRPDQLVTKDEIVELAWKGAIVSDNAISRAITLLRRAFKDNAKSPVYIETVPRKGYRLIAEVSQYVEPPARRKSHPSFQFRMTREAGIIGAVLGMLAFGSLAYLLTD